MREDTDATTTTTTVGASGGGRVGTSWVILNGRSDEIIVSSRKQHQRTRYGYSSARINMSESWLQHEDVVPLRHRCVLPDITQASGYTHGLTTHHKCVAHRRDGLRQGCQAHIVVESEVHLVSNAAIRSSLPFLKGFRSSQSARPCWPLEEAPLNQRHSCCSLLGSDQGQVRWTRFLTGAVCEIHLGAGTAPGLTIPLSFINCRISGLICVLSQVVPGLSQLSPSPGDAKATNRVCRANPLYSSVSVIGGWRSRPKRAVRYPITGNPWPRHASQYSTTFHGIALSTPRPAVPRDPD